MVFHRHFSILYSPAIYKAFNFSTSAPIVVIHLFDYSLPSDREVLSYRGSDLHLPVTYDVKHLFICVLAIYISFLDTYISNLFILKIDIFTVELHEFFIYILDARSLYYLQIFSVGCLSLLL